MAEKTFAVQKQSFWSNLTQARTFCGLERANEPFLTLFLNFKLFIIHVKQKFWENYIAQCVGWYEMTLIKQSPNHKSSELSFLCSKAETIPIKASNWPAYAFTSSELPHLLVAMDYDLSQVIL